MYELKRLDGSAIPAALEKAFRYRLLNEPSAAESICLDILAIEPENQTALVTLLLSLSDQFDERPGEKFAAARVLLPRLGDEYAQLYYHAILCERRANAALKRGGPGGAHVAYEWYRQAMHGYERAADLSPPGNNDATLRWNTCARVLNTNREVVPDPGGPVCDMLE